METGPPMTAQCQSLHFDGLCRLIGEVKQDCNLTLRLAKRLGADASGFGSDSAKAVRSQSDLAVDLGCDRFRWPSQLLRIGR
jgi:hypothetical protein